jgi:squalene cyclase
MGTPVNCSFLRKNEAKTRLGKKAKRSDARKPAISLIAITLVLDQIDCHFVWRNGASALAA